MKVIDKNGTVIIPDMHIGRGNVTEVGTIISIGKIPEYKPEDSPSWYAKYSGKKFKVVEMEVELQWKTVGMIQGPTHEWICTVEEII